MQNLANVQAALQKLNFYHGVVDGLSGEKTKDAIKRFQFANGLKADGLYGNQTEAELFPAPPPTQKTILPAPQAANQWPHERDITKFYGEHGGHQCTAGIVKPKFGFRYCEDMRPIKQFSCHEKVADSFQRIFDKTLDAYGAEKIRELRLDVYGGCFNDRLKRGSKTERSTHSWGIAIDLDPARNQLRQSMKSNPKPSFCLPEYQEFWRIVESEGGYSLGRHHDYDWMHFQFARK